MGNPRVRAAVASDADDMGRVHVSSWRAGYRGLMPDGVLDRLDPVARADWHRQNLDPLPAGTQAFVAEVNGRVVGFIRVGEERDGDSAEVYAIYVDPAHWGTGAGRALLDAGVTWLTGDGPRPVRLWTLDGNERARRFYERCGFVADGATGSHPVDGGRLDVPIVRFTLAPGG